MVSFISIACFLNQQVNKAIKSMKFKERIIVLTIQLLLIAIVVNGQTATIEFENGVPIDQKRYEGVKGSPYYFDDWSLARITNIGGDFIDSVLVNYNGITQEFEVTNGTKFIQLNQFSHKRLEVFDKSSGEVKIFIKSIDKWISPTYNLVHYEGHIIKWVGSFRAKILERKLETPGRTEIIKYISESENDYFVIVGESVQFKRKRKKILEALETYFPEAPQIVKSQKLDIESDEGLIALLDAIDLKPEN